MWFFACLDNSKYLLPIKSSVFLTPSPTEIIMESPTSTGSKCLSLCNNNIFTSETYEKLTIDTVDSMNKINAIKHPGQAVKIITDDSGEHTVVKDGTEVCKYSEKKVKNKKLNSKCYDENMIKFIFTKHGIEVISDVETIV